MHEAGTGGNRQEQAGNRREQGRGQAQEQTGNRPGTGAGLEQAGLHGTDTRPWCWGQNTPTPAPHPMALAVDGDMRCNGSGIIRQFHCTLIEAAMSTHVAVVLGSMPQNTPTLALGTGREQDREQAGNRAGNRPGTGREQDREQAGNSTGTSCMILGTGREQAGNRHKPGL